MFYFKSYKRSFLTLSEQTLNPFVLSDLNQGKVYQIQEKCIQFWMTFCSVEETDEYTRRTRKLHSEIPHLAWESNPGLCCREVRALIVVPHKTVYIFIISLLLLEGIASYPSVLKVGPEAALFENFKIHQMNTIVRIWCDIFKIMTLLNKRRLKKEVKLP